MNFGETKLFTPEYVGISTEGIGENVQNIAGLLQDVTWYWHLILHAVYLRSNNMNGTCIFQYVRILVSCSIHLSFSSANVFLFIVRTTFYYPWPFFHLLVYEHRLLMHSNPFSFFWRVTMFIYNMLISAFFPYCLWQLFIKQDVPLKEISHISIQK